MSGIFSWLLELDALTRLLVMVLVPIAFTAGLVWVPVKLFDWAVRRAERREA